MIHLGDPPPWFIDSSLALSCQERSNGICGHVVKFLFGRTSCTRACNTNSNSIAAKAAAYIHSAYTLGAQFPKFLDPPLQPTRPTGVLFSVTWRKSHVSHTNFIILTLILSFSDRFSSKNRNERYELSSLETSECKHACMTACCRPLVTGRLLTVG